MHVYAKSGNPRAGFYDTIGCDEFHSTLEMPDGRNPNQNAWLTITLNYGITFVDGRTPNGIAYRSGGHFVVKDSNRREFPLRDWDMASMSDFVKRFQKAEQFWNYKFLLITPDDYDKFDFFNMNAGVLCRPNVICLFRLKSGGTPTHLDLSAVRLQPDAPFFRSSKSLYETRDVYDKTVNHELGHALDQLHIRALLGDERCVAADINADPCYETPGFMPSNIMGRGTNLSLVNAKPWRALIEAHTTVPEYKWGVTMAVNRLPTKTPVAA
jgi:hypothetical protein